MALIGKEVKGDGASKRQFIATFDNGTLEQLDELKAYFKTEDHTELLKLAVSILQRAKDSTPRTPSQ